VSLSVMSPRSSGTGIGRGARAAMPTGGEAATQPPVVRYPTGRLQRVRAFTRATQRAEGSTCCRSVEAGGSAWLIAPGGRRGPAGRMPAVRVP